ncbi:alcohol dehydrogenase [Niveomyces insectorum RCEF 264]|uniref:Alcohol dehydrogenase n=1 Tax=Niveomyces insectorum RCEF 264 TaxID=1081102 RepID=A0A167VLU8_9HYPO|nr:alcohol dehydrogenase [Niveomyces insectorum RCEF 264]
MKGIQLSQYVKGPEDLVVSTLPDPTPAPDQYLIAVRAAATNFFDLLQIQGKYQNQPAFPWVAGAEFAGVVLAVPRASSSSSSGRPPRFAVGDRVFGASQGAYAHKVCATEQQLRPVPPGWSFAEAAGLFVTAPTGVGLAAVQVAKALGATVIATGGTAAKLAVARAFGADHTINYNDDADWPASVRALTPHGRGVDVVFDPVGLVDRSTKCTAWNGRLLVVGFAAGQIERLALNKVLLKNISVVGVHWGAYAAHEPAAIAAVWAGLEQLIARGEFRPTVFAPVDSALAAAGQLATVKLGTTTPFVGLDRVPATLLALGGRETWGKVVVEIPPEAESKL